VEGSTRGDRRGYVAAVNGIDEKDLVREKGGV